MDSVHHLEQIVHNIASSYGDGMEAAERRLYPALRNLETQYVLAEANQNARIPTALSLAIIQLLALLPRP